MSMSMKRYLWGSAASALVLGLTGPVAAQANPQADTQAASQDAAPQEESQLDEIVVTARKTSENNQRAAATIVAVSGEELSNRGVSDPQALEKFLPSASLRRQGPVTQVFIRGVGTRSDLPNFAAASALTYNGLIVQRYGTFGLTSDLDRVESIAGPQGTLYGGNAAGGAVNLFSARPRNDGSGRASLEVGDFEAFRASVAANVSLTDDLSGRVGFDYNTRDAYYSAGINTQNNYSGRAGLLYSPSDDFSTYIFYNHARDTGRPITTLVASPFANPDPYQLRTTGVNGNPIDGRFTRQDNVSDIIGTNVDFNIGGNEFTYIGGYIDFTADYEYYVGLTGNQLQVFDHERQFSQELRWNRTLGNLKLSSGLFYLRNLTEFNDSQLRFTSATASTRVLLNITDQENTTTAAYAQGVLSLSDRLRVTLGGRVTRDTIDAEGVGAIAAGQTVGPRIDFDRGATHTDYKIGVDYDLAEQVLVYANLQSGYIPFGYNPDVAPTPIVPESQLTAYSAGVKSRFFDNRLEVNAETYYYEYENFQAIQFVNETGRSTVLNAESSTIYGLDLSIRARVTPDTSLNAAMVLQRARYETFNGVGYNFNDNQMINAPDLVVQAGIQHTFSLGTAGDLEARADTFYSDGHFGSFNNFPNSRQQSYSKTDVSITYTPPSGMWNVQAFVRNLEDEAVYTALQAGTTITASGSGGLEAPRTVGVRFGVNW
ncbi:TonB-dependent receptor [Brevundimonas sp.]|uniref:TonB-dependent receptor n=1 Tax=Brevundimonas sp. TaxID=1871086 RepID=UPI00263969F1|nr:TonB-dependent receptor [Brevundimonas sp.]